MKTILTLIDADNDRYIVIDNNSEYIMRVIARWFDHDSVHDEIQLESRHATRKAAEQAAFQAYTIDHEQVAEKNRAGNA